MVALRGWSSPRFVALLLSIAASFIVGVKAERRFSVIERAQSFVAGDRFSDIQVDKISAAKLIDWKIPSPCPQNAFVILIVGQSNAGNYVETPHSARDSVFAFYNGHCFPAADPLPGATGTRGSVWSRLGDRLAKKHSNIVLAPVAVGASDLARWSPGGVLNLLLTQRIKELTERELKPDVSIFQQGEHDGVALTPAAQYKRDLISLIKQLPGERKFVALSSGCGDVVNHEIRRAQSEAARVAGAMIGVDMDMIATRVNRCHLSSRSADRVASSWANLIE